LREVVVMKNKHSLIFLCAGLLLPALFLHASSDNDGKPHWEYEGHNGPERWGEMYPDWAIASKGKEQSPIDLAFAASSNLPEITFDYKASPLEVVNNGHTIQVNYKPGSTIKVGDETFELLQFHFHSPSEHTVENSFYGMEVHFVHKNKNGELGVIGVFLAHGKANKTLQKILDNAPLEPGKNEVNGVTIDANDFLPSDKRYYAYSGSLTTPPCSEGVRWHVMRDPINVSEEQINKFREIVGENARPTQPLNQRIVRIGR
jgi:carbonic anhydrase